MQKMNDGIEKVRETYEKLKKDLALAKAGKPTQDGKNISAETCVLSVLFSLTCCCTCLPIGAPCCKVVCSLSSGCK